VDGCTDGDDSDCGGTEVACLGGVDDDCDGALDCLDSDCLGSADCPEGANCTDGLDNDVDGCTDSDDSDCGGTETSCSGGVDDDCDGAVDCADADCAADPGCTEGANCSDGVDNDLDGCTDGDDSDCGGTEVSCIGGVDDDCDGLVDCADPDCNGNFACPENGNCTDGNDNDLDGCTDGVDADCGGTEVSCSDGTDNDCDTRTDCADADCRGNPACPESGNCSDGLDNDLDGCVDGVDSDCGGTETSCKDGADNDCDGITDCLDSDCAGSPDCVEAGNCFDGADNDSDGCTDGDDSDCGGTETSCIDGIDNDCDLATDCADADCTGHPSCPETGNCGDGNDNDGNTLVDCDDPACDGQPCMDDGYACTLDFCRNGRCVHQAKDNLCRDGLFCTGEERCEPAHPSAGPDGCLAGVAWCTDPGEECVEAEQRCRETACRDDVDNDSDGVKDCWDADCPPASPENCWDGIDNDCNGLVDCEDIAFCGADRDGDGHRVAPCGGDCDDTNPDVHPGRLEDCFTRIDDDCDGLLNCVDPDCQGDRDGDGQAPAPCGEDCDDDDPLNYFRNQEDCTDGQDNNCNDLADCLDPECTGQGCNDGIACTVNDMCTGILCGGAPEDGRCDDGLFCNGEETCEPGSGEAGPDGCVEGTDPCLPGEACNEATDTCEETCTVDAWEPDNACTRANPIVVTKSFGAREHTLCPEGDRDRVIFDVEVGSEYTLFSTGGTDTRGLLTTADCVLELAFNNDCGPKDRNFCIVWTATYTGQVVLTVDTGVPSAAAPLKGVAAEPFGGPVGLEGGLRSAPAPGSSGGIGAPVARQAAIGDYVLWHRRTDDVCIPDAYEPEDDACGTATEIDVTGTPVTQMHTICPAADVDRFVFLGEAGQTYRFSTGGGTDTRAEVRDHNCGPVLASSDGCQGDPNFCLDFSPDVTRPYTLSVYGQTQQTIGGYTFTYVRLGGPGCTEDEREPDDACDQATLISVGTMEQALQGTVCPGGDVDTFRFLAEAGKTYSFRTVGATDLRGRIESDACGITFADETTCGTDLVNFCIVWMAPASGPYKLRVQGAHGAVTGAYLLRFQETDCPPDDWEPDNNCGQATTLEVDATLRRQAHTICPGGEVDLFEFFGQKGATYHFATEGPTDTAGAVLTSDCKSFLVKNASCDGVEPNLCLTWTAPQAGIYKLGITGDETGGPYDLLYQRVEDPGPGCTEDGAEPDDVCAQATTILPTPDDRSLERTLCPPDDRDHFLFEAMAGRKYRFWTTGPADTMGNVRTAQCAKLKGNDDCDRPNDLNFCLEWTAPANGPYHVRVRGFSRSQTVGPYTFHYMIVP